MAGQEFTVEELANERWLPVVGYEAYYAVSSLGRVIRRKGMRRKADRMIRAHIHQKCGYPSVGLCVAHRAKTFNTHVLVAAAFLGPRPKGLVINHIDGNKQNPRANNLEYVTQHENQMHASRMGLLPKGDNHHSALRPGQMPRGENNSQAKLTEEQVREIRARYVKGGVLTEKAMARLYGVSQTVVHALLSRRTWRHI